MIAVDTNVLIRFLTRDDPDQADRARSVLTKSDVWLAKTVVLESEWVLRHSYGYSCPQISFALSAVLGLPNVMVEAPAQVYQALEWHSLGMDFADALHLAAAEPAREFSTFDEKLRKRATELSVRIPVTSP